MNENETVLSEIEVENSTTESISIDYSMQIDSINNNLVSINSSLNFLVIIVLCSFILNDFIYRKGWLK